MQKITDTCQPREDILAGTFNPEIFTASLVEVIRFYQENRQGIHPIYTDAKQFFTQGTYATDGFRMVLNEVFARLAGTTRRRPYTASKPPLAAARPTP